MCSSATHHTDTTPIQKSCFFHCNIHGFSSYIYIYIQNTHTHTHTHTHTQNTDGNMKYILGDVYNIYTSYAFSSSPFPPFTHLYHIILHFTIKGTMSSGIARRLAERQKQNLLENSKKELTLSSSPQHPGVLLKVRLPFKWIAFWQVCNWHRTNRIVFTVVVTVT
jgi:hypothetical protein